MNFSNGAILTKIQLIFATPTDWNLKYFENLRLKSLK